MGEVFDRVQAAADRLTAAERRVAGVITDDPQAVAFGTVAATARLAEASGASVVRLASKLGYSGFTELQAAVQAELRRRLRPATERIREPRRGDLLGRSLDASLACVAGTLGHLEVDLLAAVVTVLSQRSRSVWVVSGAAAGGVAHQFATELSMLRPRVQVLTGTHTDVGHRLVDVAEGDVVVAIDLRRYDRWVVEAVDVAAAAGATVVAVTDGPLSPLAAEAAHVLVVEAEGVGPFDNYVGALAALSTVTAGVAERLREPATERLDRIEAAWLRSGALLDPDG